MKRFALLSGLLMICIFVFGNSYAQTTPEEAPPPPPEIKVYNNRLSVKAEGAEFGAVMEGIGEKAGFEVKIGSDIYTKRVSTSFRDMLLERGINRLLDLIGQKTYFIHYGPEGLISKIEVFSSGTSGKPKVENRAPWRPPTGPASRRTAIPPRRGMRMSVKDRAPQSRGSNAGVTVTPDAPPPFDPEKGAVPEQEEAPEFMEPSVEETIEPFVNEPTTEQSQEEEPAEKPEKAPYVPPRRAPSYVPKRPN